MAVLHADASGWWIMLIGALVSSACSLIGCFLVLRRLSMLGDAISHAVLPGIVIAFLWSGSRDILPMLLGAGALGLLTAFMTDVLNRQGKLQTDAAIGVTFTWLFAIGVILLSKFASNVDIDLDCVLYGEILYAPFDTVLWGESDLGPRAVWVLAGVTLANAIFVVLGWKQLKVCAFDPGLAQSIGINVALWHYLLMGFTSISTVASFESVGAILVVAMLTVPANTAYLLTERLSHMIFIAIGVGIASSVGGYGLATVLDGSIAGAMATVSGLFFVMAALFSPRHGVVAGFIRRRRELTLEDAQS
ncbi:MAG: metal ABC transporter permease [Candidatus Hydrogenedentes bacterium]|nr:metal ABC transporter permease [Candidatus Hydrogenedentota bacterium]